MDTELKINPKLLQWAREECGYSPADIASKIHVDQAKYLDWESTGVGLSLNDLVALSKACKRQIAAGVDAETSYKRWRNSVERKLGIHVFQFAMPTKEAQGFSYSDSFPYCVTVNNAYPATSRTFTLFHELSHILRSQSGLCKPDDTIFKREDTSTEYDCNSFAGSLLVPAKEIVSAKDKDTIFKYATKFKISSEVYLRRLYTLGQVSEKEFFPLLDEIRRAVLPPKPHYSKSPVNRSINSRGEALFNSTLDAVNQRKVTYSLASDILGLKINYLSGLQG